MALITDPTRITLVFPSFDQCTKPEASPTIRYANINGTIMYAAFMALSPKPAGSGFLIRIGMVFNIANINNPAIILKILADSKTLLNTSFEIDQRKWYSIFDMVEC